MLYNASVVNGMDVDSDETWNSGWCDANAAKNVSLSEYNFPTQSNQLNDEKLGDFLRGFCEQEPRDLSVGSSPEPPLLLFVAGDRSSVGKTSLCLSLIAALISKGISPSSIGYIKPVTQCEAEQPITQYCSRMNVEHVSIGPVVFYKGKNILAVLNITVNRRCRIYAIIFGRRDRQPTGTLTTSTRRSRSYCLGEKNRPRGWSR
jgi:hypothetical protein